MELKDNHISYVEFKTNDLELIKEFYSKTFNWAFSDYGPTYSSFSESGLFGGFEQTENKIYNGALIVLYHQNLNQIKSEIIKNKGRISQDIFSFPGGYRFHFIDPSGNELAVWSENK